MKSLYKVILLFTLLISSANSCEDKEVNVLLQDMAEFDRAFIPVLFYVRHGEMDNARKSVFFLNHNWQQFQNSYQDLIPDNDDWKENFRMTDAWLSDAYAAIDANAPEDAYIFLDHVRYQMMDVRTQNKWDYFLDDVWEFEARLDVVEEAAVDQMMCLLEYCEFEDLVRDMNMAWKDVKVTNKDKNLFEMEEEEIKMFRSKQEEIEDALKHFNIAVAEAEGENLAIAATFLRVAYLDYLSSFGDFISAKHYYATL